MQSFKSSTQLTKEHFKEGVHPKLFLRLYDVFKKKFFEEASLEISDDVGDYTLGNLEEFKRVYQRITGNQPPSENYFNRLRNDALKGRPITMSNQFKNDFAKFCGNFSLLDLINSSVVSNELREEQKEYARFLPRWNNANNPQVIREFAGQKYWLYLHDYDSSYEEPEILRLKFTFREFFEELFIIEIENIKGSVYGDHYIGKVNPHASTANILVCNLKIKDTGEYYIHMKFSYHGSANAQELLLGQFNNYTTGVSIHSGTLALHRIDPKNYDSFDSTAPSSFFIGSDEAKKAGIPDVVQSYFKNRHLNYLRIPRKIISVETLEKWYRKKNSIV